MKTVRCILETHDHHTGERHKFEGDKLNMDSELTAGIVLNQAFLSAVEKMPSKTFRPQTHLHD